VAKQDQSISQVVSTLPSLDPTEPAASNRDILRAARLLFEHIEGQISRADTKAQLTMATDVIFATATSSSLTGIVATLTGGSTLPLDRTMSILTVLLFVSLVLSVVFALLIVRPNLTPPQRNTLVFYDQISKLSEDDFVTQFQGQSLRQINESLLAEVHAKAKIAARKFTGIRWSISFLLLAFGVWVATLAIHAFPR
jgi:hypothetical protein